jgi:hypothetical protein
MQASDPATPKKPSPWDRQRASEDAIGAVESPARASVAATHAASDKVAPNIARRCSKFITLTRIEGGKLRR